MHDIKANYFSAFSQCCTFGDQETLEGSKKQKHSTFFHPSLLLISICNRVSGKLIYTEAEFNELPLLKFQTRPNMVGSSYNCI